MRKIKLLALPLLLAGFCLFFMATSKVPICDPDCSAVLDVGYTLRDGRENYVVGVYRCGNNRVSDTLCVYVKDTTGINWNNLADTACMVASQKGLVRQNIFVIKNFSSPVDTLARKICP